MPKILVTGASGFIGSRVVRQLCERGDEVKVLLRPSASRKALRGLPVEVAEGDIMIASTVYRALMGCDRLYHVAANYKMWDRDPKKVLEPSVRGTREVLEAVRRHDGAIAKVVVTSSVAAIGSGHGGDPLDEDSEWTLADSEQYVVAKRRAEEVALAAKDLPIVVVNPSGVFGPGDARPTPSGQLIIRYLNWTAPIAFPGSPGGLSVVDVDDVARGHILAMEKGKIGERYILGGENLTLTQIIQTMAELTGLRGPGRAPPKGLAVMMGVLMETWARIAGGEPEVTHKMARDFFDGHFWVKSDKAKNDLGYTFRPARKTLARAIRWYLDNGYVDPKIAKELRYDELPGRDPEPSLPHERSRGLRRRMKIDLAPAHPSDIEKLVGIHTLAFPDARGGPERRVNFQDNPRGSLSDLFVARDPTGAIVGHAFLFRMRTFIAGGEVPLSGLASVGVSPEARGQGVGRAIVEGLLSESHRRGDALQMLWPFAYRFYASLGFAATSPIVRLRVPCASLPRTGESPARCTRASVGDVPALAEMYAQALAAGNGLVTRSNALFTRLLTVPGHVAFVVRRPEDDPNRVRGWVLFRLVEMKATGTLELQVRELLALDAESERSLLALLSAHRDQADVVELSLPEGHPLPMLVTEPRVPREAFLPDHLHPLGRLGAGPMVRPVDVARLLSLRGYRHGGVVRLRVREGETSRGFRLVVHGESHLVANVTNDDEPSDEPLELDLGTLGAIAVGALRPTDALRHGRMRGDEQQAIEADRLFSTGAPFRCLDEF